MRVPAPLHAPPGRVGVLLVHPVMVPSKRQVAVFTVGVPAYCVTVPGCATAVMRNCEPDLWTVPPLTPVLFKVRVLPAVVQVASVALTVMLLGRIAKLSLEQPMAVGDAVGNETRMRTSWNELGCVNVTVLRPLSPATNTGSVSVWITLHVVGIGRQPFASRAPVLLLLFNTSTRTVPVKVVAMAVFAAF